MIKSNIGHEQITHGNIFKGALTGEENLVMYRTFSHIKYM